MDREARQENRHRSPRLPVPGSHIPALDGIRGIAILLVMLFHFAYYGGMQQQTLVDRVFYRIVTAGWSGVDLFFVLSGFLITGILFDAKGGRHYFANFYMRRTLRIFPLYYGCLAVFFFVLPALIDMGPQFDELSRRQGWYWTYLVNVDAVLHGFPSMNHLGHFWSLAVEEQFYLVWPLVVFRASRRALMRVCVGFVVLALTLRVIAVMSVPLAANVLMPTRMDALAIGGFLALWIRGPAGAGGLARWIAPTLLVSGGALAVLFAWQRRLDGMNPIVATVGLSLLSVFFGALIMLAVRTPRDRPLGRWLGGGPLPFLGRYSYALYVFHQPILVALRRANFRIPRFPEVFDSQLPGFVAFAAVGGGAALALSLLSWHLWEMHFLRLKRFFPYR